ncbi:Hydrolase domain-containing protein [Rhizoctonia solani AG-1 IA]|uniref:Hydrolase domain-containing protein n=1 Tax=Thanatephorus cucumeris (strain AG1-IA) TaxID=983506 RepID=L8WN78_THACA|nr:Hydrolase domain-containing protein [Rhizoctonia solani AG-1 IA]
MTHLHVIGPITSTGSPFTVRPQSCHSFAISQLLPMTIDWSCDNTLYPPNQRIVDLVQGKIFRQSSKYFVDLDMEPEEAKILHRRYYTEYGGHPLDFDAKVDASLPLEELLTPDPTVRRLLEDIDTSKVRIWALTNAYKTVNLLTEAEITGDLFEGLVFCDYESKDFACKPERKFYDQALELAQTTAEKSYFVDDNFGNVRGAKWAHCAFLYDAALDAKALAGTGASGGVGNIDDLKPEDGISVIHRLEDLRKVWPKVFKTSV